MEIVCKLFKSPHNLKPPEANVDRDGAEQGRQGEDVARGVDVDGHVEVLVQVAADDLTLQDRLETAGHVSTDLAVVRPLPPHSARQTLPARVVCKREQSQSHCAQWAF